MKKPDNPKERNLVKGALRRVFSRSELRRQVIKNAGISHKDPNRPRVTRWAVCASCGLIEAAYAMQVDHREPLIPVDKTLEEMSWDEIIDRLWCDMKNLDALCKPCHKEKTKAETKERRRLKNEKKTSIDF